MAPDPDPPTARSGDDATRIDGLRALCLVGYLVLLATYLLSVWGRYLLNDDYLALYTAWLKASGKVAGRDFFLASYQLLLDAMVPLFRVFRETWFPLYFMRCLLVLVLVGTLALLARFCRRAFTGATGWVLPLVLMATTGMLHRGLDIRPDAITNLLWAAILVRLAEVDAGDTWSGFWGGALIALVALNRFKGLVIVPLVLANLAFILIRMRGHGAWGRAWRLLGAAALGLAVVVLPYLAWVSATDGLAQFLRVSGALFADIGKGRAAETSAMGLTLAASLQTDYLFWAFTIVGTVARARAWRSYPARINLTVVGLLVTAAASVGLNPAYYTYNLISLYALLAPFAAFGFLQAALLVRRVLGARPFAPVLAGIFLLVPVGWNLDVILDVTRNTNQHQKDLQRFILENLRPDQAVFGLEGIGLYRPSVYHWRMPAILVGRYRNGGWAYAGELARAKPELVILSYRLPGWLSIQDRSFLASSYVALTPLVLVPGMDSFGKGTDCAFEAPATAPYEILLAGQGTCNLDGRPVRSGEVRVLTAGSHPLHLDGARCLIRRYYTPAATALLANPEGLPYLIPPGLSSPERVVMRK